MCLVRPPCPGAAALTAVAGKRVDGVLVLVVQTPLVVHALSVAWKGEERVSWYQGTPPAPPRPALLR